MRFSFATLFAFASAVMAQTPGFNPITKPTEGEKVPAGSTYEIVWQPSVANPGAITIGLLGGASPQTLNVLDTIATGVDAATGSFAWKVPATLGDLATYGIKISLDTDETVFQYGFPFKIVGDAGSSSSASGPASSGASHSATHSASASTSASASASGSSSAEPTTTKTSTSTVTSTSTKTSTKKHTKTVTPTTVTSTTSASSTSVTTVRSSSSHTTSHVPSTITSSVTVQPPTSTTSSTSSIATNGVASFAPGSIAMLGGVAMAVLAL